MENKDFIDAFIGKHLSVKVGIKVIDIGIYQCPKCQALSKSSGEFIYPINLIAHLLTECKDWMNYFDKIPVPAIDDPQNMLKLALREIQKIPVLVKN